MPRLTVAALDKQIGARRLAPLYLLVGEDVRLGSRLVDDIEATVDEADRPFAVERIYAAEPGGAPVDIAAAARILPMLGDRRIVVVLRAERFLKPKRASKDTPGDESEPASGANTQPDDEVAGDLRALEDYLDRPAGFTTVVFVAAEIDRGRRFTKRLVDRAETVELSGMTSRDDRNRLVYDKGEAHRQAEAILGEKGRHIDRAGLAALLDAAEGDITRLRDDIDKLVLFAGGRTTLTGADVHAVASGDGVVNDWDLVNAISEGNLARALIEVGRRTDRGDSPHALVGQLRWWVSNRLAEQAPDRARPAIDALLRTDLALKSSGGDERVLLERLVVELTGRPLARR